MRFPRWRVTVAERRAMVGALLALTDAAWHVPIKQRRTADEQEAVERFSTAVMDARKLLRDLAERHYGDDEGRRLACTCGWTGPFIEDHHDGGKAPDLPAPGALKGMPDSVMNWEKKP